MPQPSSDPEPYATLEECLAGGFTMEQCADLLMTCSFGQAIDQGSFHNVVCGNSANVCPEGLLQIAADDEDHEVRCCSDVMIAGWVRNSGCDVWGESDVDNGQCNHGSTFEAAEAVCSEAGARLCTSAELASDCTGGSGCQHDFDLVWSSTPASGPTYWLEECEAPSPCEATVCTSPASHADGVACGLCIGAFALRRFVLSAPPIYYKSYVYLCAMIKPTYLRGHPSGNCLHHTD